MIMMLEQLRDKMLADAADDHQKELIMRGFHYAVNRVRDGHAKTEEEAKMALASFADGFCTGFHRGNGSKCSRG